MHLASHSERVLNYWWALALFEPNPAPKIQAPTRVKNEITWFIKEHKPGDILPWEDPNLAPPRRPEYQWEYTAYLGIYPLADYYTSLVALFKPGETEDTQSEENQERIKISGEGAVASCIFNEKGVLNLTSISLSSAAYSYARAPYHRPEDFGSPDSFREMEQRVRQSQMKMELNRIQQAMGIHGQLSDDNTKELLRHQLPINGAYLDNILLSIFQNLGVKAGSPIRAEKIYIVARQVKEPTQNPENFLNSMQLEDLGEAYNHVCRQNSDATLSQYISEHAQPKTGQRRDMVQIPEYAMEMLQPGNIPGGRWPSNPEHGLARAQQFTVNRVVKNACGYGQVFGVNGPPGTGKTTLLRDVIAGMVTERASKLVRLKNPGDAFSSNGIKYRDANGKEWTFNPIKPEFTGYEMVLASSNNKAVENISLEIPQKDSIHSGTWSEAGYFPELATALLQKADMSISKTKESSMQGWGILAGRMGKSENIFNYLQTLLWNGQYRDDDGKLQESLGLASKEFAELCPLMSWEEAQRAFIQKKTEVDSLRQALIQAANHLIQEQRISAQLMQDKQNLQQVQQEYATLKSQLAILGEQLLNWQNYLLQTQVHIQQIRGVKPGFFASLFTARGRIWQQQHIAAVKAEQDASEQAQNALTIYQNHENLYQTKGQEVVELEGKYTELGNQLLLVQSAIASDRKRLGYAHPRNQQDDNPKTANELRETYAPWIEAELNKARSDLFLRALDVHRAFIQDERTRMRGKLIALQNILLGKQKADGDLKKAAWQLLFMVVPTVSTTFASVPRMFRDLPADSLGWLLIDEAGQVAPQDAVGAIRRVRNVLSVGDPLQLEPVVTMSSQAMQKLSEYFGLDAEWIPPLASVQNIVDRTAEYGTYLGYGDDARWVSAPLRVHRRCQDPMFTISNDVAYNGMMVFGTLGGKGLDKVIDSAWAHTKSTASDKIQPDEMERLEKMLEYLHENGVEYSDIIVISPFRAIANKLEKMGATYPGLTAGTIHTAQGREAAVVALVLGSAAGVAGEGARRWAASAPNLVNVAVSRAKKRLFVFGDADEWGKQNYFKEILKHMPRIDSPDRA